MAEFIAITGADLVDASGRRRGDVAIESGEIVQVAEGGKLDAIPNGAVLIDAPNCVLAPGLVDMHTHLREPGGEQAETIETATAAAAAGGYTAVTAMANTDPVADSSAVVQLVNDLALRAGNCHVEVVGALTVGLGGEKLAPLGELSELGVKFFSDDGRCLADPLMLRRALEYLRPSGALIANHAEDPALVGFGSRAVGEREGAMDEGELSARLGIPGRPSVAEETIVARDIALARATRGRLHIPHVSTRRSVELIAEARERGTRVTAEVTPHHLTLTSSECRGYDPRFRVNPPLRSSEDVEALRIGLADGIIDAVATDHAPHTEEAKERAFEEALPGMIGLETALGVLLTDLVEPGILSLELALGAMSWNPARILGLERHGGPIAEGAPANLVVIDPSIEWEVDPSIFESRSSNSPFSGRRLRGRATHTIYEGRLIMADGRVTSGRHRTESFA